MPTFLPTFLNDQLLQFCRSKIGKKLGRGQCTDLVQEGIRTIGAQSNFPNFPRRGDYVWGVLVCVLEVKGNKLLTTPGKLSPKEARPKPGDILQFRDVIILSETTETDDDGSTITRLSTVEAAHHTAVLESVSKDGNTFTVLEQNSGDRLYVVRETLPLPDIKSGWIRIYRPVKK
jgi:hypothetical protein